MFAGWLSGQVLLEKFKDRLVLLLIGLKSKKVFNEG